MKEDLWAWLVLFFCTFGVISLMGSVIWKNVITGSLRGQVTGFEYSSPIFAFVGTSVAMYLISKAYGEKTLTPKTVFMILIIGFAMIMLYTAAPQYLPPSFAIIAP